MRGEGRRLGFLTRIWAIAWKDILAELRAREMVLSMFLFGFLVILIFNFGIEPGLREMNLVRPGVFWSAFIFAGMLGLNRSFAGEKENDCLPGLLLCPVDSAEMCCWPYSCSRSWFPSFWLQQNLPASCWMAVVWGAQGFGWVFCWSMMWCSSQSRSLRSSMWWKSKRKDCQGGLIHECWVERNADAAFKPGARQGTSAMAGYPGYRHGDFGSSGSLWSLAVGASGSADGGRPADILFSHAKRMVGSGSCLHRSVYLWDSISMEEGAAV